MGVHCKICITRKPENVLGSVVYKVRDGWPVTHLLQKVSASVRGLGLVSLSKDRVQWLVPVVSGLQICNASRDYHFHSLYWVSCKRSQRVEVRANCAHGRDSLKDAIMVHGFDWQRHCCQIEVSFQ